MGIRLWPPRATPANMPDCLNETQRYSAGPDGHTMPVPTLGRPALADGWFLLGDRLEASKTGKPGGTQNLTMEPPVHAQALNALSPVGRIIPSASLQDAKVRVKLSAKGYVNPANVALRRGVRGLPVMAEEGELKA